MLKKSVSSALYYRKQLIHSSPNVFKKREHPLARTWRILKNDVTGILPKNINRPRMDELPTHVDILIIGGAAVGSSVAYWMKERTGQKGLEVAVVEKDPTYATCSTVLSVGGLRQQFSLSENIQMSLYGAEFIRTLKRRFGDEADVQFCPNGYLTMASEAGVQQMLDSHALQRTLGAVNCILTKDQLKEKFPWLNVSDIELACLGLEKEGWFDPWSLLCVLRKGALDLGTQYIKGEVTEFVRTDKPDVYMDGVPDGSYQGINEAVVTLPNKETHNIKFAYCIVCTGADSGHVARLANIGQDEGILSVPLPVEKRKRYVYCFECQDVENCLPINTPLSIDYTGAYFRRDGLGPMFIGGLSPQPDEEPDTENLDVDHNYFDERIWPILAHRVPAFNSLKVRNAWGGYYDYNYFDHNGIIGPHPYYYNLLFATGFSGHGIQQAPAVGRAIAELILDGKFQTIDLSRFAFDRLIVDKPMLEAGIV